MPDQSLRVPVWCPLCSGLMKGRSTLTFYDWGVCVGCHIEFVDGREERWKEGWRPSKEEVERRRG
jgi:hypothetical protein